MAYLHHDRETFAEAVHLVTHQTGLSPQIVEKDYYVTMLLRLLAQQVPYIVFKGGTSLSKCHQVIKRFSEDIDIAIDNKLSQGEKRKLKTVIMECVSSLGLAVGNVDEIRSRRDYNRYEIVYDSVIQHSETQLPSMVLLETSYTTTAFPAEWLPVSSYIGEMMKQEASEWISQYELDVFEMKVQGINRTLIDKVFAVCDYYLQGKEQRHSRHLYDIYKLLPLVPFDENFRHLVKEVRKIRSESPVCVSAPEHINISQLLEEMIESEAYKSDYKLLTEKLLDEDVPYEEAIKALQFICDSRIF